MTKVQQTFATLHTALLDSGVNLTSSAHTEVYDMPDRFWTVFTEGSYYRDYSIDNDEYDDANVFCSYYTEPEEDYDENSSSYVSLIISTKYSSR